MRNRIYRRYTQVYRTQREAIIGGKSRNVYGPFCGYWALVRFNSKRHNPQSKASVRSLSRWLPERMVSRREYYRYHNIAGRKYRPVTVHLDNTPFVINRIKWSLRRDV